MRCAGLSDHPRLIPAALVAETPPRHCADLADHPRRSSWTGDAGTHAPLALVDGMGSFPATVAHRLRLRATLIPTVAVDAGTGRSPKPEGSDAMPSAQACLPPSRFDSGYTGPDNQAPCCEIAGAGQLAPRDRSQKRPPDRAVTVKTSTVP